MNEILINKLKQSIEDLEQVAREIYYAMSFLDYTNPARANLKQALKLLGIHSPNDVGLSDSVLSRTEKWKS